MTQERGHPPTIGARRARLEPGSAVQRAVPDPGERVDDRPVRDGWVVDEIEETLARWPQMELAGEPERIQALFLNQDTSIPVALR